MNQPKRNISLSSASALTWQYSVRLLSLAAAASSDVFIIFFFLFLSSFDALSCNRTTVLILFFPRRYYICCTDFFFFLFMARPVVQIYSPEVCRAPFFISPVFAVILYASIYDFPHSRPPGLSRCAIRPAFETTISRRLDSSNSIIYSSLGGHIDAQIHLRLCISSFAASL
jgi:hypothetical protein